MTRLIDDLLDLSRITRGAIKLAMEHVNLEPVLRDAIEASRPLIRDARHELSLHLPNEAIHIEADPTRLAQIFANLLNNAAKYTEPGGRIDVHVQLRSDKVVVSVRDTGVGIEPANLPLVFEPFAQFGSAGDTRDGLGIGLAIARDLVRLHGGHIEVRSEGAGKGSEFIVQLPVAQSFQATTTTTAPIPGERRFWRILIVEDNEDSARTLELLLRAARYETHVARDGIEGVEAAESVKPDIILMDIGMPRLNGYDAARRIRQQPWGAQMILIALTGWGQDSDKRLAQEAGFDHHLTKPVDWSVLQSLLDSVQRAAARP
jgi:CheY-like chemotaxis protein/two-component sensor histidine kinase